MGANTASYSGDGSVTYREVFSNLNVQIHLPRSRVRRTRRIKKFDHDQQLNSQQVP